MRDCRLLYAAAFVRAFAVGLVGVLLAFHLAASGLDPARIGHVVSAGLFGIAAATLLVTLRGDRLGRRRLLMGLAALSTAGLLVVVLSPSPALAVGAAFLGMLNGAGRDRGAQLTLEHAILAGATEPGTRTKAFAWFNLAQDLGGALGAGTVALMARLRTFTSIEAEPAQRGGLLLAAAAVGACVFLYRSLSDAAETGQAAAQVPLSPATRRNVLRISALFTMDALGGGFVAATFLAWFFRERFGVDEGTVGLLFMGSRVLNALSHLGAAWLAKRIGLVNTMVFTHAPSSLLLATMPFAPSFGVAAVLYLLREGLVEMDVPTRQSYVNGIVRPEERTRVNGITNLVRMGSWAVAAEIAGRLLAGTDLWVPLVASAALKITYDLLLWRAFRGIRPPEEMAKA